MTKPKKTFVEQHTSGSPTDTSSFSDLYISTQGHNVHRLKAKDSTGRWAYYFVFVSPVKEKGFLKALKEGPMVDLERYGTVLASCYGEEPTKEIKDYLFSRYQFVV